MEDIRGKLHGLTQKLDQGSQKQNDILQRIVQIDERMAAHESIHDSIDEFQHKVTSTLYDDNNGLVVQARDCKKEREHREKAGLGLQGWLMVVGTLAAAGAAVAALIHH